MSVCKYYLNGSCRYGDKCWFIHQEERFSSKGEYCVSPNQRSLWKPSSPPIAQKNYGSSGVSFSFNNALSSSNRNAATKKSLFSINRFEALSDDEDMEHVYEGSSRYSSSAPSSNFIQQHNSGFSLSHIANTTVAPQHVGLFKPKPANNEPGLVSTSQTGIIAPQHVGLFKPKIANNTPGLVTSQTGAVAPQHVGLFKPKFANDKPGPVPTSQKPVQFSFSPNQFKVINNLPPKEHQNLFKQTSFSTNSSISQVPSFSQTKTLFGKPVEGEQGTSLKKETISRSSVSNTILSESLWLEELGSDIYTKIHELTPYEKDCFSANVFELHNVPLRPPPKELCF